MQRALREEIVNCVTHAAGAVLAVAGLAVLLLFATETHDMWRIVSCSIYGTTLVLVFLASALYHGIQKPHFKRPLRILDHSSIYLVIAGTYTPFTLVTLRGPWGWALFGIVWSLALFGLVYKFFFIDRFPVFSVLLYLVMGWLAVVAIKPMLAALSLSSFAWLAAGGLLYTGGVVFYLFDGKLRYAHAIWHVFVVAASVCHYIAILFSVLSIHA